MTLPDYESAWTDIASSNTSASSYKEFDHKLGEVPILVDVQVKAIDGPNKGYIFQASGHQQRDDDQSEEYGGVIYIYSETSVRVSAPLQSNQYLGRTIYTGASPYWVGPNTQDSWSAQVRVRCWRQSSLPKPDFSKTGTTIKSTTGLAADSYQKISHGINGTPNLVVSRIQFDLAGTTVYADSVGSAGVIYQNKTYISNGYVVFGYDSSNIQVWAPSDIHGQLVFMGDGYGIVGNATVADLQLYAWSNQTLPYTTSGTLELSSTQNGSEKILDFKPAGNENQVFTRSWIQSSISPSSGYRFPGTGALSYETTAYDKPCTYGGMVYAYTTQAARFWQPGNANGAMVCIASCLGTAINNQALNEGIAVLHSWELDVNDCLTNPCKNGATCENYFQSYACRCAPGYAGTLCENDIDECENHECQNGATCVDIVDGFTCTCAGGYAGDFCETDVDECSSNPCLNKGTCVDETNRFKCVCADGFTGPTCTPPVLGCPEPDAPTYGFVNTSAGLEVGNIINYTCVEGYGLVGMSQRTCLANLTWSGSIPYCMIECPQLHIPNGAADTSAGRHAGSTAVFMCTAGYILSVTTKLVCESTGFWKGVKPTCNPVWMWAVLMTILVLMLFVSVVTIICLANTHCTYQLTPRYEAEQYRDKRRRKHRKYIVILNNDDEEARDGPPKPRFQLRTIEPH